MRCVQVQVLSGVVALLAFAQVAIAQEEGTIDEVPVSEKVLESEEQSGQKIEMAPMVIVATRSERKAFEVGRSVDLIAKEEIERKSPESLPDLLNETTGVHVQKTNAGAGSPIIRGFVGVDNLILVDGVRFNNSTFRTGPNQYLAMIDPWALERVEVIRGPGSVLYGSDALGGTINAVTLGPRSIVDRAFGASWRFLGNSSVKGGGGSGQLEFDSDLVQGYVGGTFLYNGELRGGGGEIQPLSDLKRFGGRGKATQTLGDHWTATEAIWWTSIRGAGRTDSLGRGIVRIYDNDDLLGYVRGERKGTGWLRNLTLNVSIHRTREVLHDYRCKTDKNKVVLERAACLELKDSNLNNREELEDVVLTPGFFATWEASVFDDRLHVLGGADGYYDVISSSGRKADSDSGWQWKKKERGNYSDGSTYLSLGAFLVSDVDFLRLRDSVFNIGGGVRLSHFSAHAENVPGLDEVDYEHTGVVSSASLKYLFHNRLNLYVDFSQGFRAPNLQETTVLGSTGHSFEVPNGSLDPVESNTLEVGAKVAFPKVRLAAAGFVSFLDGVFQRTELSQGDWEKLGITEADVSGQPVYRRENAISGTFKGIEGSLEIGPFFGTTLWNKAAWSTGEFEQLDRTLSPAPRMAPTSGASGVRWSSPDFPLYGEFFVKWAMRQDRLAPEDLQDLRICEDPAHPGTLLKECKGTPGWLTYNIRAGYKPREFLEANLSIENLTDKRYKYHASGILAPGFNVMLSLAGRY